MTVSTGPSEAAAAERGGIDSTPLAVERLLGAARTVVRGCLVDGRATVETFRAIGLRARPVVRRGAQVAVHMFAADGRATLATLQIVVAAAARACIAVMRACAADVRATFETFRVIGFRVGAVMQGGIGLVVRVVVAGGRGTTATLKAVSLAIVRGGVAHGRVTLATLISVMRRGGSVMRRGVRLVVRMFAVSGRATVATFKVVTLAVMRAGVADGRATLETLRSVGLQAHAGLRSGTRLVARAFAAVGGAIIATTKIAALAASATLLGAARVIAAVRADVVATFKSIAAAAGVGGRYGARIVGQAVALFRQTIHWTISSAKLVALDVGAGLRRCGRAVLAGLSGGAKFVLTGQQRSAPFMQRIATGCAQAIAAVYSLTLTVVATSARGVRHMPVVLKRAVAGGRSASDLAKVTFEVLSGLHGGVLLRLENGDYQIGSTAEADIVLRDPGVAPAHAILGVQRGAIRLEATGGDVGIGEQMISKGHGCRLKLPLDLSLGEACFRLSAVESQSAGRLHWAIAGIAVCFIVFAGLLTIGSFHYDDLHAAGTLPSGLVRLAGVPPSPSTVPTSTVPTSSVPPLDRPERDQDIDRVRSQVERSKKPGVDIDEALQELTARINGTNIRNLRVSAAQGRLLVSGLLDKRDVAAWSEVERWFDQTYQGRVILTTNFSVGGGQTMPVLQLRAVWFGEGPYVVTADGRHLTVGAGLDNGWTIKEIGQDRTVLAKDGESVPQSYR
jgi:Inner membrane component of T3SS, cytoplasmic domain/Inner membrane component of T3SS, periplasmic domain